MPDENFHPSNPAQPIATRFAVADPRRPLPDATTTVDLPQVSITPLAAEPGTTNAAVPPETVPDKA
jgi:hypothetical protein